MECGREEGEEAEEVVVVCISIVEGMSCTCVRRNLHGEERREAEEVVLSCIDSRRCVHAYDETYIHVGLENNFFFVCSL